MEELHKNKRKSAIWRLVAIGIFLLAILSTGMVSMHNKYADSGKSQLQQLQDQYKEELEQREKDRQNLQSSINKLNKDLKNCKDKSISPEEKLGICEGEIKVKDDEIKELNEKLQRCDNQLASAKSGN